MHFIVHKLHQTWIFLSFLIFKIVCIFGCTGLCCCSQAFSCCSEWGLLSSCGAQASQCGGKSSRQLFLQSLGSGVYRLGNVEPHGMWNLPGPGLKPVSPELAGRFLTTGPPGKSSNLNLKTTLLTRIRRTRPLRTLGGWGEGRK